MMNNNNNSELDWTYDPRVESDAKPEKEINKTPLLWNMSFQRLSRNNDHDIPALFNTQATYTSSKQKYHFSFPANINDSKFP